MEELRSFVHEGFEEITHWFPDWEKVQRIRYELQLPLFDGMNPEEWAGEIESHVQLFWFSKEEEFKAACVALDGEVWRWFQWEHRRQPFFGWEDLKDQVVRRFGVPGDQNAALIQGLQAVEARPLAFEEEFKQITEEICANIKRAFQKTMSKLEPKTTLDSQEPEEEKGSQKLEEEEEGWKGEEDKSVTKFSVGKTENFEKTHPAPGMRDREEGQDGGGKERVWVSERVHVRSCREQGEEKITGCGYGVGQGAFVAGGAGWRVKDGGRVKFVKGDDDASGSGGGPGRTKWLAVKGGTVVEDGLASRSKYDERFSGRSFMMVDILGGGRKVLPPKNGKIGKGSEWGRKNSDVAPRSATVDEIIGCLDLSNGDEYGSLGSRGRFERGGSQASGSGGGPGELGLNGCVCGQGCFPGDREWVSNEAHGRYIQRNSAGGSGSFGTSGKRLGKRTTVCGGGWNAADFQKGGSGKSGFGGGPEAAWADEGKMVKSTSGGWSHDCQGGHISDYGGADGRQRIGAGWNTRGFEESSILEKKLEVIVQNAKGISVNHLIGESTQHHYNWETREYTAELCQHTSKRGKGEQAHSLKFGNVLNKVGPVSSKATHAAQVERSSKDNLHTHPSLRRVTSKFGPSDFKSNLHRHPTNLINPAHPISFTSHSFTVHLINPPFSIPNTPTQTNIPQQLPPNTPTRSSNPLFSLTSSLSTSQIRHLQPKLFPSHFLNHATLICHHPNPSSIKPTHPFKHNPPDLTDHPNSMVQNSSPPFISSSPLPTTSMLTTHYYTTTLTLTPSFISFTKHLQTTTIQFQDPVHIITQEAKNTVLATNHLEDKVKLEAAGNVIDPTVNPSKSVFCKKVKGSTLFWLCLFWKQDKGDGERCKSCDGCLQLLHESGTTYFKIS